MPLTDEGVNEAADVSSSLISAPVCVSWSPSPPSPVFHSVYVSDCLSVSRREQSVQSRALS